MSKNQGQNDGELVGEGKKFQIDQRMRVEMTDIKDATNFSLRKLD